MRFDVGWDDRKGKSNAENITGGTGGEGFGGGKGGYGGGKGFKGSGKSLGGGGGDGRSIYVSGFDFGADDAAVREHFGYVGTIESLHLDSRGSAVVQYVDAAAAQRAVAELNRTTMSGHSRYVSVKMDGERSSKGKGKGKGKKYDY